MTDLREPLELTVHTTASAEELWTRWQYLCELVDTADRQMTEIDQRCKQATDPLDRTRLWSDYKAAAREYRVLASWRDVFYAAYIFATDGGDCAAFDVSSPR